MSIYATEKSYKIDLWSHKNGPYNAIFMTGTFTYVVKLKNAIILFKAIHNLLPVNVQRFFSIYELAYTTGHNCHFKH